MLLMGKSTISMAIFHCYVSSPEGISMNWRFVVRFTTFMGVILKLDAEEPPLNQCSMRPVAHRGPSWPIVALDYH